MTNPERITEQVVEAQERQEEGPGEEETAAVRCGAEAEEMGDGNLVEGWRIYCGLGLGVVGDGQREGEEGSNRFTWFFFVILF
jgi:hypothetical protein